MTDQKVNNYTRRQFLNTSLVLASAATTVPSFLMSSSNLLAAPYADAATSSLPGVPEDRILVVIQLSGGNDGLNTLIPFGESAYYNARPQIKINESDILTLDQTQGLGLNPNMSHIHELALSNQCAILPGIGYPNPNRSHFASMDVYHAGDTNPKSQGWIGKAFDASLPKNKPLTTNQALSIISIGAIATTAVQGKRIKPIAYQNPESLRWIAKGSNKSLDKYYEQIQNSNLTTNNPTLDFIYRTSLDAQIASDRLGKAVKRTSKTKFPQTNFANQLKQVAAMIANDLPTRIYYVTLGGFDTHANQIQKQNTLLKNFSDSVNAFLKELKATGDQDRVMTLAFSEFGRRVQQNASAGTDHGAAGLMFLFGNHLASSPTGIHGTYPSLTDLEKGDLKFNRDFRSVYADLLDNWLELDSKAALGQSFKHAEVIHI
ncbi:DUF1501 domain-containing protein [Planctomycetota bacterium]|nr:DUF1501 domain-containing protein [Planctomycetota bacterium]